MLAVTQNKLIELHCVKRVRIWSFSGPYFPAFVLNTERYSVFFRIQSEYRKIWTTKTSNTDTSSNFGLQISRQKDSWLKRWRTLTSFFATFYYLKVFHRLLVLCLLYIFDKRCNDLEIFLLERGCCSKLVRKEILPGRKIPRNELLDKERSQGNDNKLTFNDTYYPCKDI